jgi:hypothetical protein
MEVFSWFSLVLQANAGMVAKIMPKPLPFAFFHSRSSLIKQSFDAIWHMLLTASLNKPHIKK